MGDGLWCPQLGSQVEKGWESLVCVPTSRGISGVPVLAPAELGSTRLGCGGFGQFSQTSPVQVWGFHVGGLDMEGGRF